MDPVVLKERYEQLCAVNSDMGYHMPYLVETAAGFDCPLIIELGVRYGASTIAWMYDLQNHPGHLWSVDCSFPITDPETGLDLLNSQGPLGVVDYWTFILGYDTWWAVMEALPTVVDIVMIDTNHVYEETLIELEAYYPRVRPGGVILLHDTMLETTGNATTPQPAYPVLTAMTEFCAEHGLEWANREESFGLGTIRV